MTLEAAVFAALMEHPTINALVDGRIDPNGQLKQDQDFPRMTQEVINNSPQPLLSGKCPADNPIVEIMAYATTKAIADQLIGAVNQHLQGYKNKAIGILGCTRSDQRSQPMPTEPNVYVESASFNIWHHRS